MAKILVIEDDAVLQKSLKDFLGMVGHSIESALNGSLGLQFLNQYTYDVVILDWDLPDIPGIEVLTRYRANSGTASVLMLTGKDAVEEKERALDAGADDYVTKPFLPRELRARIGALLRRPALQPMKELSAGNLVLDLTAKRAVRGGDFIYLSPLEFTVLEFFMRHPNEAFTIEALVNRIWDADENISDEAIYTCIRRLRTKIDTPGQPSKITTLYARGYCFNA